MNKISLFHAEKQCYQLTQIKCHKNLWSSDSLWQKSSENDDELTHSDEMQ